ncbi:nucleotidyltransferase domain-containing protein [Pseudomonas sp. NPDC077186]|uniref:nucleotidyltransferase domain-containing protein n=1 Tax=Pseudomonas sp. NPDC077186 TaxID=3364421 RepID=UPI0037C75106
MSYVVIKCGSSARGDTNENSDLDLVCIWSGSSPDYKSISNKYGDIMFYSQETIRRMREKGSLFLTHLDVDSKYVCGDANLLLEFRGFRPLNHQTENLFNETRRFIASVDWFPNSDIGRLWLCDLLYVSLRGCVYCKNAINGIFVFGFLDALKACELPESVVSTLLNLREGKYAYRKKSFSSFQSFNLRSIEQACKFILEQETKFRIGGITNWSKMVRNDYWGERLIERAILNGEHRDDEFMRKITHHNYNKFTLKSDVTKIVEMHTR